MWGLSPIGVLEFSVIVDSLVAVGTIGLALLTYRQMRLLNKERRATQARELAEKVYNPILQELGELHPEHFSFLRWSDVKRSSPHLTPRVPTPLYALFERAETHSELIGVLGGRVSDMITEKELQLVNELGLKPKPAQQDWVEFRILVGKGEPPRIYLSNVWVIGKDLDTYAKDYVTKKYAPGKEWDIELRVGGYRAGGKPEAEKMANLVFETLRANSDALQLQQKHREAMGLGAQISERIIEELGKPLSPWIERAKATMTGRDKNSSGIQLQEIEPIVPELERMKVQFYWDYNRSRIFALLTIMFSGLVGIMVILNSLRVSNLITPVLEILVILVLLPLYLDWIVRGNVIPLKRLVIETNRLLVELTKTGRVKNLTELLRVESPISLWKEYRRSLTPWNVLLIGIMIFAVFVLVFL